MLPDANIVLEVKQQCGGTTGHDPCRSSDCAICGSAAGALQNVSREVASRMIIREMDTVCPLADLLSSSDLQVKTTLLMDNIYTLHQTRTPRWSVAVV